MFKFLLLSAAATMATTAVAATADSYTKISQGKVAAVSSNGAWVTGYFNSYGDEIYSGFIYNVATGKSEWKTSFDATDYDKSGMFLAVNNAGVIAGAMRDKDNMLEYTPGEFAPPAQGVDGDGDVTYIPITSAAIWKPDGSFVKLGTGPHVLEEFSDGSDGSYAIGISEDGNKVVGYIQIAYVKTYPCQWTLNSATGKYEYSMLQLPEGSIGGYVSGMSADGSVICGVVMRNGQSYPCVWNSEGNGQIISIADVELVEAKADAVSPNGKYILVHGYDYANHKVIGVYNTLTSELTQATLADNLIMPAGYIVSDAGDVLCQITDNNNWTSKTYYYSPATGTLVEFDHYLSSLNPDIAALPSLNDNAPVACSGDFSVIAGNPGYGDGWVLTLSPRQTIILNTPEPKEIFYSGIDKATFKWKALENVPKGATLTAYEATVADETITVTPDKAVNGIFSVTVDAQPGTVEASVKAIAQTSAGEIESAVSNTISASLSATTDWKLFDNFDEVTIDGQGNIHATNDYWNALLTADSKSEVIQWNLESYNFENNTPYYTTVSIATKPWSSILLSRFMDASKQNNFFLSYYMSCQLVNETTASDLNADFLDVEYSTDGENWKVLSSHCAADLVYGAWNFYKVDMTPELAGKIYQIRFNAHGMGYGSLKWNIDCVNVTDKMEAPAPTGLKAVKANDKNEVNLTWHNTIGANEVSYLVNSNILTDYCTGSEGVPLITAVELTPDMTDSYAGKYITSLSCFVYDNPQIETNSPTKAQAIVWEDGVEVARTDYGQDFTSPYPTVIALDKAVQIQAGKTYKLGIRIYEYDAQQTPIYYQTTDMFIPGKTDLYSEDEGKTWFKLSDVYTSEEGVTPNGKCIWPIRANITETATAVSTTLDPEILVYNVLCNDEVINTVPVYAAYLKYTDQAPIAGGKYSVQAFYRDGRVSPQSHAVEAIVSSVDAIQTERPMIDVVDGAIRVSGAIDSIEVFAIDGTCVARTSGNNVGMASMPTGIYVVRVKAGDNTFARKIAIRH